MKLGDLWIYLFPTPTVGKAGNREGRKEGLAGAGPDVVCLAAFGNPFAGFAGKYF
jgi:hypothetical protein